MVDALVESATSMKMPKISDWIVAIVTAVVSATRFFVQLPLGCISPLSLDRYEEQLPGNLKR